MEKNRRKTYIQYKMEKIIFRKIEKYDFLASWLNF